MLDAMWRLCLKTTKNIIVFGSRKEETTQNIPEIYQEYIDELLETLGAEPNEYTRMLIRQFTNKFTALQGIVKHEKLDKKIK